MTPLESLCVIMNQMTHPSIVIVEDDPEIGDLVARYLRGQDMEVMHALDGKAMDAILSSKKIDLIILDINLPGEDGLSICRRLRVETRIPIIMLTARNDDIDKILNIIHSLCVCKKYFPYVDRFLFLARELHI